MEGIIQILNENYPIRFERIELVRDMGSTSYITFSGNNKYFLRVIKPAFFNTAVIGADIQLYLQNQGFPVPLILLTNMQLPYVKNEDILLILYEFIEGNDSDPEQDAEAIGALVGRLHQTMKEYSGQLVKRDKQFYIGRYIDILRKRQYSRVDEFFAYGEVLWEKIKELQRGFCHGDMYRGNIHKTPDGRLFVLDFDTACEGFPMYDLTLICDMTKYFDFDERNYERSNKVLSRFVPEYLKYNPLSQEEIYAFCYLIALQHFATQATVMDIFGAYCLDDKDLDNQLVWLYKWREQCGGKMCNITPNE
jgi:Ser/Thr protein kinase RdoA (MazF antagonist)